MQEVTFSIWMRQMALMYLQVNTSSSIWDNQSHRTTWCNLQSAEVSWGLEVVEWQVTHGGGVAVCQWMHQYLMKWNKHSDISWPQRGSREQMKKTITFNYKLKACCCSEFRIIPHTSLQSWHSFFSLCSCNPLLSPSKIVSLPEFLPEPWTLLDWHILAFLTENN